MIIKARDVPVWAIYKYKDIPEETRLKISPISKVFDFNGFYPVDTVREEFCKYPCNELTLVIIEKLPIQEENFI